MRVRWFRLALRDLQEARAFIARDRPTAAQNVARKIVESIDLLAEQPGIGRPGRVPGTRELVIPGTPFIVPYRVKDDVVEILRIFHGARRWPDRL